MRTKDLKANPKNPRKISPEKLTLLKKAMLEFGDISGIVYNRRSKQLVTGHQRITSTDDTDITITKKYSEPTRTGTVAEGFIEIDGERFNYRVVDWDRHREMAANIAANKGAGEWDLPELTEWMRELNSFDADNFDISLTMFDPDEIADFTGVEVEGYNRSGPTGVDEDLLPERPQARTQFGNIFQLSDHRLMCGDSTNAKQVEKLMGGEKAIIFLTDPPYGVSYSDKNAYLNTIAPANRIQVEIEGDNGSIEESGAIWLSAYTSAIANCSDRCSFYIFSPQGGDLMMMMMMMMIQKAGWTLKHMLVWVKNNHVLGRCDYHYKHEPIFYGWNKKHDFYGGSCCFSVLEFPKPQKSDLHPTMKPIELLEKLISNSSKMEGIVLDLFGGSGSTLIACEKTNRQCRMMELDPHYCDVIIERWEKYTGQTAKLLNPPKMAVTTKLRKAPAAQGNHRASVNG